MTADRAHLLTLIGDKLPAERVVTDFEVCSVGTQGVLAEVLGSGCIGRALDVHRAQTLADMKRIQQQGGRAQRQIDELALIDQARAAIARAEGLTS